MSHARDDLLKANKLVEEGDSEALEEWLNRDWDNIETNIMLKAAIGRLWRGYSMLAEIAVRNAEPQ